jgi:hypothetical protein
MAVTSVEKVKAWLTPGLITCFGMISWNLITEIRGDVKQLLASNAEVQVRIQSLEKRMDGLENVVYAQRMFALKPKEIEVPKRNNNN